MTAPQDDDAAPPGGGARGAAAQLLDRRSVAAWVLYDFANSVYPAVITATVFSVYYATTIVGNDDGLGDLWWGRAVSLSMLVVALSSPLLGAAADRSGARKKMLFFHTALCVGSVALLATVEPGMVLRGFLLVVLANIGFEGALVYYNSYLPDIAPPWRRGFVSGLGFATGYAGSVMGLLAALVLVDRGRFDLTWLFVALFFAVFSLPAFLVLPGGRGSAGFFAALAEGARRLGPLVAEVMELKELSRFLAAFFVYIDGINTIIYFTALFAATTLGFAPSQLIGLFLAVQLSALVGAAALAGPTDRWGPKAVITAILAVWTCVVLFAFFVRSRPLFFAVAVAAGAGLGAVQSASRALMASLIPAGREARMFGFYALCGKSSSVVGPLLFGWISHGLGGDQRTALLSVAAFFVAGLVLLQRVETPPR
ncbi:MAG TPA: MFS transporter [Deltaproteobacteria bacterium]|nr:MFS transporter [Deltaproteobacteria bacterium]